MSGGYPARASIDDVGIDDRAAAREVPEPPGSRASAAVAAASAAFPDLLCSRSG